MTAPSVISLSNALKEGDLRKAEAILADGVDVNSKDLDGWMPLHVASYHGYVTLVVDLIKVGADVNAVSEEGDTAMHMAARRGHKEIVEVLLDHDANTHPHNKYGDTPLHEASVAGHKEIARLLRTRMNRGYWAAVRRLLHI